MKIAFINGSPKNTGSASELPLAALQQKLGDSNEYVTLHAMKYDRHEFFDSIKDAHAAVISFPLYVDGLPSHLLRLLHDVKDEIGQINPSLTVYAIANNGFYEGAQNRLALAMIRNFCISAGIKWGQGLGIGAGGMMSAAPIGHGPLKNIGTALDTLSGNIKNGITSEDFFVEPNFPKILYKLGGHSNWRSQAKKNGLKRKDLYYQHEE